MVLKDEFDIRRALSSDARAVAAVHRNAWLETYTGLIPEELFSSFDPIKGEQRWRSTIEEGVGVLNRQLFVACRGAAVLGFILAGPQRDGELRSRGFTGEIQALYVLKSSQRMGIGTRLMKEALEYFKVSGRSAAALWVLRKNFQARLFYEGLDARVISERKEMLNNAMLSEVSYGWSDLQKLEESLSR